jgi:hypothetical protein
MSFVLTRRGGRKKLPYQGYRSDIHYDGENIKIDGIYCVWPEFLDDSGEVILEDDVHVPCRGTAYMWILFFDEMWDYHAKNAIPGRKLWFMEGGRKVADAVIVEQIGLIHHINKPARKLKKT